MACFFSTYVLTLANPATILSFIAVFAALGLGTTNIDYIHAIAWVLGITLGSIVWWLFLSGSVALVLHHRLNTSVMQKINRISGVVIFIFALWALSMQ